MATRFSWGACATAGVLGCRGVFGGEARTWSARVGPFSKARADNRLLWSLMVCMPLFHGAQLAVDTTMVSTFRADLGRNGAALDHAPSHQRAHFSTTNGEGPDSWCLRARQDGNHSFFRQLARARAWSP